MKHTFFTLSGTTLLFVLAFLCTTSSDQTIPVAMASMEPDFAPEVQCSCTESFQGEPTMVVGTVHFDPIPLGTNCSYKTRVTISYSPLTVKNRFRVLNDLGNIVASTAFVNTNGTLTFCAEVGRQYFLHISATSPVNALDRWNASVVCGPACQ